MVAKFWIKLYHEILDDPKMGKMSDRLWRRTIELFLLAGRHDQNGELPGIEDICWALRIEQQECNETLHVLQRNGIATCNDVGTWTITHFADRQSASTSTERSREFRRRNGQKEDQNPFFDPKNETIKQRNVAKRATKRRPELELELDKSEKKEMHTHTEKFLSDNRSFGIKLTKLCGYSGPEFVVNGNLDDLAGAVGQLVEWKATPEQLDSFGRWWWGKTPPTFRQVVSEWGKFLAAQSASPDREPTAAPPLDDAKRAAYAAMLAADQQAAAESAARVGEIMANPTAGGVDVGRELKRVARRMK